MNYQFAKDSDYFAVGLTSKPTLLIKLDCCLVFMKMIMY